MRPGSPLERTTRDDLTDRATRACLDCPLFATCLEQAVVHHDVAGFVAATTATQRRRMRRLLHVTVPREDLDAWTGAPGRVVRTADVVRARRAHPDQPLGVLAERLGCSLSTVKRHLRRAHTHAEEPVAHRPDRAQVLAAFAAVTRLLRPSAAA